MYIPSKRIRNEPFTKPGVRKGQGMKIALKRSAWIVLSVYMILFIAAGVKTGEWNILFFIIGFIILGSGFLGSYYKNYPPKA